MGLSIFAIILGILNILIGAVFTPGYQSADLLNYAAGVAVIVMGLVGLKDA